MFDKLKKLPVPEILYLLSVNVLLYTLNILAIFALLFDGSFELEAISMPEYLGLAVYILLIIIVIPAYFYWILFHVSVSKSFSKAVYFFKFNTKFRWIMYLLLCIISPTFWGGVLSLHFMLFILGVVFSLAMPLMLLYSYWGLKDKLPLRARKIYGYINKALSLILSLVMAGLIYKFARELPAVYILTILTAIFLCLSIRIEVVTEKIKKYKWHSIPLWISVIYATLWGIRNEWVTYYVLFISGVLLLMLIFEKPLLKWRSKNEALHIETEEYYKAKLN